MCRHTCYIGAPVTLEDFLFQPDYGLLIQSYKPREMLDAEVNVDGFGLGWYLPDGTLIRYTNTKPIWADKNVRQLAPLLDSTLWVGNVRSATLPETITESDTPPYCVKNMVFSHNGFIRDFQSTVRPLMRKFLRPEIEAEVHGTTDSEYLFAVLRQLLPEHGGNIGQTILALFDRIQFWGGKDCGLFNIIASDGRGVFATRHAFGGQCPSLYVGQGIGSLQNGWLITSEPTSDDGEWSVVPENHMVSMEFGQAPQVSAL